MLPFQKVNEGSSDGGEAEALLGGVPRLWAPLLDPHLDGLTALVGGWSSRGQSLADRSNPSSNRFTWK